MGVSVVFGGQFGSEGKGKTTYYFAKKFHASAVVRVGGVNSGHIITNSKGEKIAFRILPVASMLDDVVCVLPAGSYIDIDVLKKEIELSGIPKELLKIHPNAVIIDSNSRKKEHDSGMNDKIGSTESGTGAAVVSRILRNGSVRLAKDCEELQQYLGDTVEFLRDEVSKNREVLIEGTQGFGLSLLHAKEYPFATSRDTSASAFVSEAGLSPFDVKNIIMTIRAFPIRVAGNSGPLPKETTWDKVTEMACAENELLEKTTVTQRVRRVAEFDSDVVRRSIMSNRPNIIVMNHCDYFDYSVHNKELLTEKVKENVKHIEGMIGHIDYLGTGDRVLIENRMNK